jgi:hypothetical protein
MKYEKTIYDISIDEHFKLGVEEVALVESPAIEIDWVALAEQTEIKLAQDDDKQLLVGPALIPDKLIYRIHPKTKQEYYIRFSAETIEKIVNRYFKKGNQLRFNYEHNNDLGIDAVVNESWIVKNTDVDQSALYGFKLPVGTWMLSVHIENKEFWQSYVKKGLVKGFSIEGEFAQQAIEMAAQELVDPKAGETEDEFIGRCIANNINEGMPEDQAAAVCYSKWEQHLDAQLSEFELTEEEAEILIKQVLLQESYRDYPVSATNAAKRALKYKEENPNNTCGTRVGWARANQLANREPISEETIARMASFARHLQWENIPYEEGCGGLMVDAWGSRTGIEWAKRKLEQIRRNINK